jgi:hypothetical protein
MEKETTRSEIPDYWGMFFSIWQSNLNIWKIWAKFYSPPNKVET